MELNKLLATAIELKKAPAFREHFEDRERLPYVPTEPRLLRLEQPNDNVINVIRTISPFVSTSTNILNDPILSVVEFYNFSVHAEIERMTEETKQLILSRSKEGWRKTFKSNRKRYINYPHEIFEDDYQKERLKYVVEKEEEPRLFTEEEYLFMEEQFLFFVMEVAKLYLNVDEAKEFGKELDKESLKGICAEYAEPLMMRYGKNRFSHFVFDKWIEIVERGITIEEVEKYEALECSVLVSLIEDYQKDTFYSVEGVEHLARLCGLVNELETVLKKDDYLFFLSSVINYCDSYHQVFGLKPGNSISWTHKIYGSSIIKSLPNVIAAIQKIKMNNKGE